MSITHAVERPAPNVAQMLSCDKVSKGGGGTTTDLLHAHALEPHAAKDKTRHFAHVDLVVQVGDDQDHRVVLSLVSMSSQRRRGTDLQFRASDSEFVLERAEPDALNVAQQLLLRGVARRVESAGAVGSSDRVARRFRVRDAQCLAGECGAIAREAKHTLAPM